MPPLVVLAVDLLVRWPDFRLPTRRHVVYYLIAIVVSIAFWRLVCGVLGWAHSRARVAGWSLSLGFGALEGLLLVGAFQYYAQFGFGVLPNLFGFQYVYEEPQDAAAFFAVGARPGALLAWLAIAAAVAAWVSLPHRLTGAAARRLSLGLRRRWPVAVAAVAVAVGAPVLHHNVRFFPNAFPPEIHTVFSFTKATAMAVRGGNEKVRLLGAPMRPPLTTQAGPLAFDVLILLNEGVRRSSQELYDLSADPLERNNLVGSASPDLLARLRAEASAVSPARP